MKALIISISSPGICDACGSKKHVSAHIRYEGARVVATFFACEKCYEDGSIMTWFSTEVEKLSASEAVYGFAAWLTCRKEKTVMSNRNVCGDIAILVDKFIKANQLRKPRNHWGRYLHAPKEL